MTVQRRAGRQNRSSFAYEALRDLLRSGKYAAGAKMPSQPALARELGVALMTLRQALSRLEREGQLISRRGSGTYVAQESRQGIILGVGLDPQTKLLLWSDALHDSWHLRLVSPAEAIGYNREQHQDVLALVDAECLQNGEGDQLREHFRNQNPPIPVVVLTQHWYDLTHFGDDPEASVLVLTKPVNKAQLHSLLSLHIPRS